MAKNDPYAKFSINYPDHPKIAVLSDEAFRAHVEMILYAARYETDGRIAKRVAKRWADDAVAELCDNDDDRPSLTQLDNGDYMLHGYGDSQTLKADIEAKREQNRENARLGGLAKKRNAKRTASETVEQNGSESLSENVPEVRSKKLEVRSNTTPPKAPSKGAGRNRYDYPDDFEDFWTAYPKSDDKRAALKAWKSAVKRSDPESITAGAKRYRDDPNRVEAYTKNASTWLNADAWENGPLAPRGDFTNKATLKQHDQLTVLDRLDAYDQQGQNRMLG